MPEIAALIVAGGSGSRIGGGLPKQYRSLAGTPMLRRSVETFLACPAITSVRVVIGADQATAYENALAGLLLSPAVSGGETRQESVRRGLAALADIGPDYVLIHDAARPLVSRALIEAVTTGLTSGAEAVLPLLPIPDSLRRMEGGHVGSSLPREGVCRAWTVRQQRAFASRSGSANAFVQISVQLSDLLRSVRQPP